MTVTQTLADRIAGKRLLIFDFDGTVADTSPLHARAFAEVLAPLGLSVDYGSIAGLSTKDAFRKCFSMAEMELSDQDLQRVVAEKQARVRKLICEGLDPLPGVDCFLRSVHGSHQLAMVTSGSRETVSLSLAALGYEGWFDPLLCAEDVTLTKPSPEGFLKACAMAGVLPDDALVFEDSRAGIEAALAAHLECVDVSAGLPGFPGRDAQ